ncbi:hypothetical protein EVJ58_g4468 [Rhodofomes roseus]|uniref:Uncharacterized protein n=1 Tax=Rhodofomes roseus TaxID=34475 RepID=A0A4Y9YG33_9APHY|nr:hypothetical protein EVJ58_g4468 [Rhodofomes roseus]
MVRVFDRFANLVASRDTALDDISALQGALRTARKEQHRLQTEMMQTERDAHDALNTAEAAAGQIKEARKEIQELRREQKAQERRRDLQASEKAKETETLYETIRAHKAKEIKQAARIRELKQQLAAAEEVASANHNISAFVTPRASRAAPHYARSPRRPESTVRHRTLVLVLN